MDEPDDGGATGEDGRGEDGRQCEHGALCVHACVVRLGGQTTGVPAGKVRQRFG
jgi:hypothetical protein